MKNVFHKFAGLLPGCGACAVACAALLSGCGEPSFKIKGEIYGAEDKSLVLEKSDFYGRWVAIDSTRVSSNGNFSISRPAPKPLRKFSVSPSATATSIFLSTPWRPSPSLLPLKTTEANIR